MYELVPKGSTFTENVLYNFGGRDRPGTPSSGLAFSHYSLYGTAAQGGAYLQGAVYRFYYENGAYHEKTIYSFSGTDGASPDGSLIPDANGTLYGVTEFGGAMTNGLSHGTAYSLSGAGTGTWSDTVLYSFTGPPFGVRVYRTRDLRLYGRHGRRESNRHTAARCGG